MKKADRPILEIPFTVADRLLEGFSALLLAGYLGFALYVFSDLPETVAAQYNFKGDVTRTGSKLEFAFLPILATFLWAGLTVLSRFPHTFNVPITITPENAFEVYQRSVRVLRYLKTFLTALFFLLSWQSFQPIVDARFLVPLILLSTIVGGTIIPLILLFSAPSKKVSKGK